jgi:hypothetical protein
MVKWILMIKVYLFPDLFPISSQREQVGTGRSGNEPEAMNMDPLSIPGGIRSKRDRERADVLPYQYSSYCNSIVPFSTYKTYQAIPPGYISRFLGGAGNLLVE